MFEPSSVVNILNTDKKSLHILNALKTVCKKVPSVFSVSFLFYLLFKEITFN